jgi:hypothetical protein
MATPRESSGRGTVPAGVTATATVGGSTTTLTATATNSTRVVIANLPVGATNDTLNTLVPLNYGDNYYLFVPTTGVFAKIKSRPGEFIFETETPVTIAGVSFQIVTCRLQSFSIINIGTADALIAESSLDGTAGYVTLAEGEFNNVDKNQEVSRAKYVGAWAFNATGTTVKIIQSNI